MYLNTLSEYLKERFGEKIYKISLSTATTCPNRDGTKGTGGCIFCSQSGSGDFAEHSNKSITDSIENAKYRVSKKFKGSKYVAYFQSYTSTYAPIEKLKNDFLEAINHPDIVALSIGTRPDCLPDEIIDLLSDLNKIKPVWVELGLQTIHEKSAKNINRCYELTVFDEAVLKLKQLNINIVVHMIIGLPGETEQMIFDTAEYIGKSGADGIKFHLLHVLKGTKLEKQFLEGNFSLPSLENYAYILSECIKRIPKDIVIHRLTGDGNKKELIAPTWSADKKHVLNYINKYFKDINIEQGELVK